MWCELLLLKSLLQRFRQLNSFHTVTFHCCLQLLISPCHALCFIFRLILIGILTSVSIIGFLWSVTALHFGLVWKQQWLWSYFKVQNQLFGKASAWGKKMSLYNWNWLLYDCVLFCKQVFLKLFLWCLGKWKGHNDEHSQL